MKFLEYTPLARLNAFLNNVNLGECILKGSLEAYSCKPAGQDRKLSRSLEQEVLDYLAQSPDYYSSSPVGPLCSTASMVQARNFSKECVLNNVKQKVENYLLEAAKVWATENGGDTVFLDSIWKAIDEVIDLADCEVYNYMPEFEGDPFMESGAIWSFNFFFYNKKLKRILSFSCCCLSKLANEDLSANEMWSDEDNIFNDMDME
uniref:TSA: Wollemia nobilis Ref_Wollemi_Transcript_22434_1025 transcribed RNA sequence n=1 Tax=Wollemia nobilis TaxID=56998 RepID=A0A0C9S1V5_9CONI